MPTAWPERTALTPHPRKPTMETDKKPSAKEE
jgi:hypothetical protein